MILLGLTFLLILVFMYNSKVFFYALMVFFVLFDMLDGFYEDEKIFAAMRYIVPIVLALYFIIKESAFKKSDRILFILFLYLAILLVYSNSEFIVSAKTTLAVFLTLIMIPAGRYIGQRVDLITEFEWFNRFLLVALPIYIGIANVLHFGESYSEAFTTGFLITSRMYIVPIVVFLAIHYLISAEKRRWTITLIDVAFIIINVGIIIINTRRTALGMLFMALIIYGMLNRRLIFKMIIMGLLLVTVLVLTYPLYEQTLTAQLEKRERIKNLDTYEEEGRYLETLYIIDYHSKKQSFSQILFGVKLFDSYDFGEKYFGRNRPIHSDFNMIFYSTGLVGCALFALMFAHYLLINNKRIALESRQVYFPILSMFFIVLIPGRFIGTMTYAPLLMLLLSAVKAWVPVAESDLIELDDDSLVLEEQLELSK
jgi:hypothetical protein